MSEVKQLSAPMIVLGVFEGKSAEECLEGIEVRNADEWTKVTSAVGCAGMLAGFLGRQDLEEKLDKCRELIRCKALGLTLEEVA